MNRKNLIAMAVAAVLVVVLIIVLPPLLSGDSGGSAPVAQGVGDGQAPPISDDATLPPDHPDVDEQGGEGQSGGAAPQAEELVAAAEKAYQEKPKDLNVLLTLGDAYLQASKPAEAEKIFSEALAVDPASSDAKAGISMVKFVKGDVQGAKADLEKVTQEDPKNQTALYDLAIVYFSSDERDKAKATWQQCADVDPKSELGVLAQQFLTLMSGSTSSGENPHGGNGSADTSTTTPAP